MRQETQVRFKNNFSPGAILELTSSFDPRPSAAKQAAKYIMHLSMSSRRGGRRGIGWDFDIFSKIAIKFPTPGQKCEVKYTEIPQPRK